MSPANRCSIALRGNGIYSIISIFCTFRSLRDALACLIIVPLLNVSVLVHYLDHALNVQREFEKTAGGSS